MSAYRQTRGRALDRYRALSFAYNRWKGDYGGKVQHFFPANHVEEVSRTTAPESSQQVKLCSQILVVHETVGVKLLCFKAGPGRQPSGRAV